AATAMNSSRFSGITAISMTATKIPAANPIMFVSFFLRSDSFGGFCSRFESHDLGLFRIDNHFGLDAGLFPAGCRDLAIGHQVRPARHDSGDFENREEDGERQTLHF